MSQVVYAILEKNKNMFCGWDRDLKASFKIPEKSIHQTSSTYLKNRLIYKKYFFGTTNLFIRKKPSFIKGCIALKMKNTKRISTFEIFSLYFECRPHFDLK